MSQQDVDDRREYYRIDDSIALEIQALADDDDSSLERIQDESPLFNLLSDLHATDFESQHLARHIGERDRTLANYLKSINKRIDLLGRVVAQHLLREIGPPRRVVLSEGGLGLVEDEPRPLGQWVVLKIVLLPQALGMLLKARIVHCQPRPEGGYEVGAEFEAISDAQRQLLARHILQKQAAERRLARQQILEP